VIVDLQRSHTGEGSVFKLRKSINGGTERWGHGVPNSGQDHLPLPILFAEDVSETHKSFGQRTISWWGSLNAVLDQRYIREEQLCSITHGTKFAARLDWPEELTQELLVTPTPTQTPAKRVLNSISAVSAISCPPWQSVRSPHRASRLHRKTTLVSPLPFHYQRSIVELQSSGLLGDVNVDRSAGKDRGDDECELTETPGRVSSQCSGDAINSKHFGARDG
jgi:hypothetical protein